MKVTVFVLLACAVATNGLPNSVVDRIKDCAIKYGLEGNPLDYSEKQGDCSRICLWIALEIMDENETINQAKAVEEYKHLTCESYKKILNTCSKEKYANAPCNRAKCLREQGFART